MQSDRCRNAPSLRGGLQGAAWLSSARAVRCQVKSYNERNPYVQLPAGEAGDSGGTAYASREEGGDDVKSARPLRPGRHTCYNGRYRSHGAVNTFPGLVHTARQAMKAGGT